MKRYELMPTDGKKSFCGKAVVIISDDGAETLESYGTPVIRKEKNGELIRLWNAWSVTTGRHVAAFAGINKKQWDAMEVQQ